MPQIGRAYQSRLIGANFGLKAASLVVGQPTIIGEYVVNAKEAISLGKGFNSALDAAEGRIFLDLKNGSGTNIEGLVRISVFSPQRREKIILGEWRTEALRQTAKRDQEPLPEMREMVTEDDIIVIMVLADAAGTVGIAAGQTTVAIDITRYEVTM